MDPRIFAYNFISVTKKYRFHILVFTLTLFFGLMIAHPVIELNDEWISLNQLNQLHAGHQVVVNEGKYGLSEKGKVSLYFENKSNLLGYSIALPLLSLPSLWLIDFTGSQFPFLILYLWTGVAIFILAFFNVFFREYAYIGKWRWTDIGFISVFVLFFINLHYYLSFPVDGFEMFPEVIAIVFINCILLSLIAVMVYEINYAIFKDCMYALFGTVVALSCSSYFIWMTGCKDHILTIVLFTAVLLWIVKYHISKEYWYLPLTFIFAGLLAWVRPELAFWVFLALCVYCTIIIYGIWQSQKKVTAYFGIVCAPFFTLIGAIPFFTNNFMVTKNIFIPAWILWNQDIAATSDVTAIPNETISPAGITAFQSLSGLLGKMIAIQRDTFFTDLFGVLFSPSNGGIGVFPLVPLFFVLVIIIMILWLSRRISFTIEEKGVLLLLGLVSFAVFITYCVQINSLNTSLGVLPDMRYLTPLYIPLTVIGLFLLKKVQLLTITPLEALKRMAIFWIIAVPVSLILTFLMYSDLQNRIESVVPLNSIMGAVILLTCIISIVLIIYHLFISTKNTEVINFLIPVLCALPLIWQIDVSFYIRAFATGAGYTFWIPIMRILFDNQLVPLILV